MFLDAGAAINPGYSRRVGASVNYMRLKAQHGPSPIRRKTGINSRRT